MSSRQSLGLLCLLMVLRSNPAGADDSTSVNFEPELSMSYLWDGGAVPFFYGSIAVGVGIRFLVAPPESPRLFPASEGGLATFENTVPELALGIFTAAGAGLIAAVPGPARWYHLKGYGQAVATTLALTSASKNLIGRHRPHYQADESGVDQRRSFFSGHSSLTLVSTVYLGLYLREHVFPRYQRSSDALWKAAAYGALAAVAVGVPVSRLEDNRHHLSDVMTGAVVGSAAAAIFYAYQERRFRDAEEDFYLKKRTVVVVIPDLENRGLTLVTHW